MKTMTKKKAPAQKYHHHVDQLAWVEPRNLINAWVDLPGRPSDRDYWECRRLVFTTGETHQILRFSSTLRI